MDYIDVFLKTDTVRELSPLEARLLGNSMLLSLAREALPGYKKKICEPFVEEEKLLVWFKMLAQTPNIKWMKEYYRLELHGAENVPMGGAMLVSNHTTPYLADGAAVNIGIHEQLDRVVYGLGHKVLRRGDVVKTVGGTYGKRTTAVRLLQEGKLAYSCPEGIYGACRQFWKRHVVLKKGGFERGFGYLHAAFSTGKPVVPIGIIGADETIIIIADMKKEIMWTLDMLDKLTGYKGTAMGRLMYSFADDSRVIPIPITPPMRSRVVAYVGEPIDVRGELGYDPGDEQFERLSEKVRTEIVKLVRMGHNGQYRG